jgi:hypothetical protein
VSLRSRGWLAVGAVEAEPGEDRFVKHFAGLVRGGVVEVTWSVEEFECGEEDDLSRSMVPRLWMEVDLGP